MKEFDITVTVCCNDDGKTCNPKCPILDFKNASCAKYGSLNGRTIDGGYDWDEVVIFGEQGNERISAEDVAGRIGTINYEIVCILSKRVPRVYLDHNEVVKVKTFLS